MTELVNFVCFFLHAWHACWCDMPPWRPSWKGLNRQKAKPLGILPRIPEQYLPHDIVPGVGWQCLKIKPLGILPWKGQKMPSTWHCAGGRGDVLKQITSHVLNVLADERQNIKKVGDTYASIYYSKRLLTSSNTEKHSEFGTFPPRCSQMPFWPRWAKAQMGQGSMLVKKWLDRSSQMEILYSGKF